MVNKAILGPVLVPAVILLVPLIAMRFTNEVAWGPLDFAVAWTMMFGIGLTYQLVTRRVGGLAYRVAVGFALAAALLLVWVNLAVGIIGSEANPANLLNLVVLAVGFGGARLVRLKAAGMARVMVCTAVVQMLVPAVAWVFWPSDFSPGVAIVFAANSVFALLFVGAAWLFRLAARQGEGPRLVAV